MSGQGQVVWAGLPVLQEQGRQQVPAVLQPRPAPELEVRERQYPALLVLLGRLSVQWPGFAVRLSEPEPGYPLWGRQPAQSVRPQGPGF